GLPGTPCIFSYNRYRPFWPDHILYKKSGFTDHRSPTRLIPSYRTIFKTDLQLPVIVIAFGYLFGQPGAKSIYLHRFRTGHLAHHIYIMYATVNNGTKAFHQVAMQRPHFTATLLVKVHAHHQRFAQLLRKFNEFFPGGMMPEDITHHEFAIVFF